MYIQNTLRNFAQAAGFFVLLLLAAMLTFAVVPTTPRGWIMMIALGIPGLLAFAFIMDRLERWAWLKRLSSPARVLFLLVLYLFVIAPLLYIGYRVLN